MSFSIDEKNREQPALFSREVARGEKDLEAELFERGDESRPFQYCVFCWKPVDRRAEDTRFEATVWLLIPNDNSSPLREYTGKAAHGHCVERLANPDEATPRAASGNSCSFLAVLDEETIRDANDRFEDTVLAGQLVLVDIGYTESGDAVGRIRPADSSDGVLT